MWEWQRKGAWKRKVKCSLIVLTKITIGEHRAAVMIPALGCVTASADESDCSQFTTAPDLRCELIVWSWSERERSFLFVIGGFYERVHICADFCPSFPSCGILMCVILKNNKMETVRGSGILQCIWGHPQTEILLLPSCPWAVTCFR